MPEAAPSAAPAAPAAPSTPAPEAPKTHHAAAQPRTPQGQFNGPPDPTKTVPAAAPAAPPPPKSWKLGDREVTDPDELYAEAQAARAERAALERYRNEAEKAAKRAAELEAKTANPRALLTPELEEQILLERARAWQEEQHIRSLPPEQQELIRYKRQLDAERRQFEAAKSEAARVAKEAQDKAAAQAQAKQEEADTEEMRGLVTGALKAAGLPETSANFFHVTAVMRGAGLRGVLYPPEVIAHKVKQRIAAERAEYLKGAPVTELLTDDVVTKLGAVEDPVTLRKLAQVLGDKLRRLNLEDKGLRPVVAPAPTAGNPRPPPPSEDLPAGDPKWQDILERRLKG